MDIILGGRKTGRTTLLIDLAAEAEAKGEVSYIVCHTHEEAYRIFQKAKELEKRIGFPLVYREFLGYDYSSRNIKNFFIDNADYLLQSLTPVNIQAITMLKEPDE